MTLLLRGFLIDYSMLSRMTKGLLLAALLLGAGRPAGAYTDLHPYVSGGDISTITLSWDTTVYINNTPVPLTAALSTDGFATVIASGTVTGNTRTYAGLTAGTTFSYTFRVKIRAEDDGAYPANQVAVSTTVAAPGDPAYFESYRFSAPSSFTAVAGLGWGTSGNPDWTTYEVAYADNSGFTGARTGNYQIPPVSIGGLNANTTYYFKARARAFGGDYTAYTATVSSSTLAMRLTILGEDVHESSVTVSWVPVSDGVQAQSSEGYRLLYSLSESMAAPFAPWNSPLSAASSATLSGLTANTTYYYTAGALNWIGTANLSNTRSFTTLAAPLAGFQKATSAGDWSDWTAGAATFGWTALPSASGYRLEASVSSTSWGAALSSSTYDTAHNSLTLTTLDSNTTYYFRAGSLNQAGNANYTAALSSVTLAQPIAENLTWTEAEPQVITVHFIPLPDAPQAVTCEGYRLEASSRPFGSGAEILFSSTTQSQADRLAIGALTPNVTYYLRLGTLNWQLTPNYTQLPSAGTPLPWTFNSAALSQVWQTTATVTFASAPENPSGYIVQASTDQYFDYIHRYSSTTVPSATSLKVSNLNWNTYYYFRAGALFNGATVYVNTTPSHGYTRPKTLSGQAIDSVFYSSISVHWTALTSTDAHHYQLEAATSTAFNPVLFSSTTDISAALLPVAGLAYNTSYFFRVGTGNEEGALAYTSMIPSTSTLANAPSEQNFESFPSSITAHWLVNGNPSDTRYLVELSSYAVFSPLVGSSTTILSSSTFTDLESNIYYWTRVIAINRLGRRTPAVNFPVTATGASDPGYQPFTDIGVSSMTIDWRGNNPDGTRYMARISTSPGFDTLLSSVTDRCSGNYCNASFFGLISNVTYYLNVSALNVISTPTFPAVDLGQALTRPATAQVLAPAQAFTNLLIDGFSFNWGHNGNSALTTYRVQAATEPGFTVISSTKYATGETGVVSGLLNGTTYWARVQAIGQSGIITPFISTGTVFTLSNRETSVVAQQDNTITLNTSFGPIVLFVPKGSIGSSIYSLDLTPISTFPVAGSAVSELHPTNIGIEINYFPETLILNALTITMPYNPAALPAGMNASKLVLALFDETNRLWVPLPSVSDTSNHRVIGQTWHLSTFQLMEGVSQTGLSGVKIYPNPYKPNSVFNVMHFTNMTAYAKIRIYTFLGELVAEVNADVNGMAHWDGLNSAGAKAASGVYIAFIQSRDKRSSKSYKVAIER